MELLQYLLSINSDYIVLGLVVVLFTVEQILAQFKFIQRPKHLFNNGLFKVLFILINLVYVSGFIFCIQWLNSHEIGLFYLVEVPFWIKLILGVMLFDLVFYWFHRMSHKVPFIWRFHRVHHSDSSMDVSTAFRVHPIELFLWFSVSRIVAAGIFGLDLVNLGFMALVSTPIFFLVHSNIKYPVWLDRTLGLFILTPNQHRVHHEIDHNYTDSNYADVCIFWDRLFGTYRYKPVEEITYGLEEFDSPEKESFWYLLKTPFINIKQK